jgi:hypothetical protein
MRKLICAAVGVLLLGFGGSPAARARDWTGLELAREGNRYVGEQARDKVLEIHSDKSIGGLSPSIWHVVYYDSTATFKATEVKFGAGQMMDVKRPMKLLQPLAGSDVPFAPDQLKVDSDKALKTALKEPLLEKLSIKAAAFTLGRVKGIGDPVWKIKLWAAKLHHPDEDTSVGEVQISATDGKVLKSDLQIDRVD